MELRNLPIPAVLRKYLRPDVLVFAAVFAVAMAFALYTNTTWEDFYITYRSSKNLALGNGLVYTIGQRVHSFTSPINVLLPAILIFITNNSSDALVLWLFRIISGAMLAGAAVLLYRIAAALALRPLACIVLIALLATDPKIIAFSINGQEVGFMIFFIALTLYALLVPPPRSTKTFWQVPTRNILLLGLAWAGLMWTRPDGFIYIGVLAISFLIFNAGHSAQPSRLRLLKMLLCAGGIAAALYLPWVLWAWSYYGSPIPNTIIAKGLEFPMGPRDLLVRSDSYFLGAVAGGAEIHGIFAPIYFAFGGWSDSALNFADRLAWIALWYWILPFGSRAGRAVSFAFLLAGWYVFAVTPGNGFPWYYPSVAVLGIFVVAIVVHDLSGFVATLKDRVFDERVFPRVRWIAGAAALFLPVISALILAATAMQLRVQQREIEEGNRKAVGLWLHEHARTPSDTVFLEPLGYIGYYSQLKMYDMPGLASPEVIAARRRHPKEPIGRGWLAIIRDLQPDWLVLRPDEGQELALQDKDFFNKEYGLATTFDASTRIWSHHQTPAVEYLQVDEKFYVFARRNR